MIAYMEWTRDNRRVRGRIERHYAADSSTLLSEELESQLERRRGCQSLASYCITR